MKALAQFKKISILLLLFIVGMSINVHSQNLTNKKIIFVRVYDFEGKKIAKGHFNFATDSILELKKGKRLTVIPIEDISYIATKRSTGKSVLVGSITGGLLGTLIGAATASGEETKTRDGGWLFGEYEYTTGTSRGTGALIGGAVGITGGALTGLGISLFKKSKKYLIEGDLEKWKIFKEYFN